jgi:hypothetical protein
MVNVFPLTVAGPLSTLNVTASPELVIAVKAIGGEVWLRGLGGFEKLMVCAALLTVN